VCVFSIYWGCLHYNSSSSILNKNSRSDNSTYYFLRECANRHRIYESLNFYLLSWNTKILLFWSYTHIWFSILGMTRWYLRVILLISTLLKTIYKLLLSGLKLIIGHALIQVYTSYRRAIISNRERMKARHTRFQLNYIVHMIALKLVNVLWQRWMFHIAFTWHHSWYFFFFILLFLCWRLIITFKATKMIINSTLGSLTSPISLTLSYLIETLFI